MNSDDEKRLAEIRAAFANWSCGYDGFADVDDLLAIVDRLIAKLDESERARKEAEAFAERENDKAGRYNEELSGEIRARREAVARADRAEVAAAARAIELRVMTDRAHAANVETSTQREKAERAEAALAEERAKREAAERRKAEAAILDGQVAALLRARAAAAESRATEAERLAEFARDNYQRRNKEAQAAEARVRELEERLRDMQLEGLNEG